MPAGSVESAAAEQKRNPPPPPPSPAARVGPLHYVALKRTIYAR